jgi:hypothetical protein
MKKKFSLEVPGKDRPRVLELVRGEVGKYVNREKRKPLPLEHEREFACRVGPDEANAVAMPVKQVHEAIGQVAATGAAEVFVEIVASTRPAPARDKEPQEPQSPQADV